MYGFAAAAMLEVCNSSWARSLEISILMASAIVHMISVALDA